MSAHAIAVAGLAFGDEGKGSVVDWLVRRHRASAVVRYNGGPQAAHHVVTSDGRTHCFAQLGAGTLCPGVRTHLSRFMLVDPLALVAEERAIAAIGVGDSFARLTIDPRSIVVTPFHAALNRMQELARGAGRHGSCGRGIGQAQLDSEQPALPSLRVSDAMDRARARRTLTLLWHVKVDLAEQLVDQHPGVPELAAALTDLRRRDRVELLVDAYHQLFTDRGVRVTEDPALDGNVVLEGAQGVLLDRDHGFWPHVTPSRTTFANVAPLADELDLATVERVGVLRAYATRHGAGPLPTEDRALVDVLPDAHNRTDAWQGEFRVGWLDAVAARHALRVVGGVDQLVLTHVDRIDALRARGLAVRVCTAYLHAGTVTRELPAPTVADTKDRVALTRWISECRPSYVALDRDATSEDLLGLLESGDGIGRRIDFVSTGPTAESKRAR